MDSRELSDKVQDRLGGQIHLIDGKIPIHTIVLATLQELAEEGFVALEEPEQTKEDNDGA